MNLKLPDIIDVKFGRKLVKHLGGDPAPIKDDWCWSEFADQYPHLLSGAEEFISAATTGDPGWAAYYMAQYCGSDQAWAEGVIERATTGDPGYAAYWMIADCGSDRVWAEGVIERATTCDPGWAVRCMVDYCGSSRAWAERVKANFCERAKLR